MEQIFVSFSFFKFQPPPPSCSEICVLFFCVRYKFIDIWQVLVFAFAIHEINKREDLLPNITLGFEIYDSGSSEIMTIERTFRILSGNRKLIPNYSCRKQEKLLTLIGHLVPSCSHSMADLLSLYRYPQITYGAKDPMLDNKYQYPHIFSTIPSDHSLTEAVVALLQYFNWKWVGIFISLHGNLKRSSEEIKVELTKIGYCVAFVIEADKVDDIVENLESYNVKIIIIYCSIYLIYSTVFLFASSHGKVFITITEEGKFLPHITLNEFSHLNGSLWFSAHSEDMPGLKGFIQSANSTALPGGTFLDTIWEVFHNDNEKDLMAYSQDEVDIKLLYNIYTAVYAAAHALHREKEIYFDKRGNVPGYFDIWNAVMLPNLTFVYVHVGTFDSSAPQGEKLKLNVSKIRWHPDFSQNYSIFSLILDTDNCIKCKEHQWTDERRDKCIQRETEYLSFHDHLGIFLMVTSLFLCAITTGIYLIFYKHRTTCIVRANNLHLSYILLFSLTLSFLSSLLFIGQPKKFTCLVRQLTFGIIFATALSTLIGKTFTVVIAFSSTKPGSKLAKWMKTQTVYIIVLLLSIGQVVICLVWLVCSPPFPDTDTKSKVGKIILLCNEGSVVAFYIMVGYIGILAIVSFLLAYYARRLPDSFNESQLITFSMLVFCCVWISFIPAYINTKGRSVVAVEVFTILTSNAGLLGFIFIPKCYIILLRPELNNKEHLMRKIYNR
ncbi:hypothetical protein XELAEV_18040178mg [Xenopus laevis]|uniref:G-protein coupled receptors family 3 profile domain-containing protein n=1 Tax=Xenopus laevis TaxID=8355 RepID=A0A974C996_XENLA|nr:hypothetical protein XELAEV_18040178mg [Xenopus laevis]